MERTAQLESAIKNLANLAAVVESSGDAIMSKNLERIITARNGGGENLFG